MRVIDEKTGYPVHVIETAREIMARMESEPSAKFFAGLPLLLNILYDKGALEGPPVTSEPVEPHVKNFFAAATGRKDDTSWMEP